TGYGASSDAYHITQPLPGHTGAQRAMRMALDDAKLAPDAVDYVNAHGTSTPAGDVEESLAIARESVPPTINLHDPDPQCALDFVPNTARRRAVRHAMNNSFGFGGTNCALVVSRLSSVGS